MYFWRLPCILEIDIDCHVDHVRRKIDIFRKKMHILRKKMHIFRKKTERRIDFVKREVGSVGSVGRQNKKRDIYKKSGMSGASGGKNRRKKNGILKGKGKVSSKTKWIIAKYNEHGWTIMNFYELGSNWKVFFLGKQMKLSLSLEKGTHRSEIPWKINLQTYIPLKFC